MVLHDYLSRSRDPIAMVGPGDVFADRPPDRLLHGCAVERGPRPQSLVLLLGQPECHRHCRNGIQVVITSAWSAVGAPFRRRYAANPCAGARADQGNGLQSRKAAGSNPARRSSGPFSLIRSSGSRNCSRRCWGRLLRARMRWMPVVWVSLGASKSPGVAPGRGRAGGL